MKKIKILLMCFLCISFFQYPVKAEEQTEFTRFLTFMKEHPEGGTFTMEQDMYMKEDETEDYGIYTNQKTYTILTNGYQITSDGLEISNAEDSWNENITSTPSLIIKGSAKDHSLVVLASDGWQTSWIGVHVEAIDGTAVEIITDDLNFYGHEDSPSYISATGEHAVGIKYQTDTKLGFLNLFYLEANGKDAAVISKSEMDPAFELTCNYSVLKVTGENASIFKNIDRANIDSEGMLEDDQSTQFVKWDIASDTSSKEIIVQPTTTFQDLPINSHILVDLVRGEETLKDNSISLIYDEEAYKEGMASGKTFTLYATLDSLNSAFIHYEKDDFAISIVFGTIPKLYGTYAYISDDKYTLTFPRTYGAKHLNLYGSNDKQKWVFLNDGIEAMTNGTGSSSAITAIALNITDDMKYIKLEVDGGYYDTQALIFQIKEITDEEGTITEPTPPDPDQPELDDDDQGGNHGQGGGREEGNYTPPPAKEPQDEPISSKPQDKEEPNKVSSTSQNKEPEQESIITNTAQQKKEAWLILVFPILLLTLYLRKKKASQ